MGRSTMTNQLDLTAAAQNMKAVVASITDDQLSWATPCPEYSVAALLDHVAGLCLAFSEAALKSVAPGSSRPPNVSADALDPEWRTLIPQRLDQLVTAWSKPEAWEGDTEAGGVQLPAEAMGAVALNELVMHGWDIARATGQTYDCDPMSAQAVLGFTAAMSVPGEEAGREGLFGPVVATDKAASAFERAPGFAGRRAGWQPAVV